MPATADPFALTTADPFAARNKTKLRKAAGVQPHQAARLPTFARAAHGQVNWATWYGDANYRFFTDLQVFAGGMVQYAGRPPTLQALTAGLDAVYGFVLAQAPAPPIPGPQTRAEIALEAALEVAAALYDRDAVEAALGALRPRWNRRAAGGASGGIRP